MPICLRSHDGRIAIELPLLRARVVSRTSRSVLAERPERPLPHRLGLVLTHVGPHRLSGALPLIISWSLVRVQQGPLPQPPVPPKPCVHAAPRVERGLESPLPTSCQDTAPTTAVRVSFRPAYGAEKPAQGTSSKGPSVRPCIRRDSDHRSDLKKNEAGVHANTDFVANVVGGLTGGLLSRPPTTGRRLAPHRPESGSWHR
jgi:hypothetical protein